jgi:predicted nucleotidyltransferase
MNRIEGLSEAEYQQLIPEETILLGYRGSIAHGMYLPSNRPDSIDDKDLLGVCIASLDCYFGLRQFEQKEAKLREWDSVVYELRKFMHLLLKSNPNALCLLWLDPQHYLVVEPAGRLLIESRHLFVTKRIYEAFTGYASAQLKRMTHLAFEGYMGAKRKQLVEKHGFDTKNAAHCIRLLRMGIEFLQEGELHVHRADAQELLDIKVGKYSLEEIRSLAEELFRQAQQVYEQCTFPDAPDESKANELLKQILVSHFGVAQRT